MLSQIQIKHILEGSEEKSNSFTISVRQEYRLSYVIFLFLHS
jgi:hypothetical protein